MNVNAYASLTRIKCNGQQKCERNGRHQVQEQQQKQPKATDMRQQLIADGDNECNTKDNATDQQIGEEKCHIVQVALGGCDAQKFHYAAPLLFDHRHQNHIE